MVLFLDHATLFSYRHPIPYLRYQYRGRQSSIVRDDATWYPASCLQLLSQSCIISNMSPQQQTRVQAIVTYFMPVNKIHENPRSEIAIMLYHLALEKPLAATSKSG